MQLAFLLYKYFPFGGMQRDFRRFVEEVQARGHHCRIYYISWQGDALEGADLRRVPASATSNHRRDERFLHWVQADMAKDPVDGVIGFNKMPGLDVYYAADPCFLEKARTERGWLYICSSSLYSSTLSKGAVPATKTEAFGKDDVAYSSPMG